MSVSKSKGKRAPTVLDKHQVEQSDFVKVLLLIVVWLGRSTYVMFRSNWEKKFLIYKALSVQVWKYHTFHYSMHILTIVVRYVEIPTITVFIAYLGYKKGF